MKPAFRLLASTLRRGPVLAALFLLGACGATSPAAPTPPTPPPLTPPPQPTELWTMSGVGNAVFSMPASITRVRIVGEYTGQSSFFIVHVGECAIVEDRLGTAPDLFRTRIDGTYVVTPAGNPPPATSDRRVEILDSAGVSWTITEDRVSNGGSPCYLY